MVRIERNQISEYLEQSCVRKLVYEAGRIGRHQVLLDFKHLEKLNPKLADSLIEAPELILRGFNEEKQTCGQEWNEFRIGFTNLPHSRFRKNISDLRALDSEKLVIVEGIVKSASGVYSAKTQSTYHCKNCGNDMTVLHEAFYINKPKDRKSVV